MPASDVNPVGIDVAVDHPRVIQRGATFSQPGWEERNARRVVLFLRTTCPICKESVPLYHRLIAGLTDQEEIDFLIASPEPIGALAPWLDRHQVTPDGTFLLANPTAAGFVVTPTLLVINRRGIVSDVLMGRVSIADEARLWNRLSNPATTREIDNSHASDEIDEAEFRALRTANRAIQILDVRERAPAPRHVSRTYPVLALPRSELQQRASVELSKTNPVVVDCTGNQVNACRAAAATLRHLNFSHVSILSRHWEPPVRPGVPSAAATKK